VKVKIIKLCCEAKLPVIASKFSVGFDLYSVQEVIIPSKERRLISTGIAMEIPYEYELQIRPRSGLAVKHGLTVLNSPGTIDPDYRGELKILLINTGSNYYKVSVGDRIAQGVFNKIVRPYFQEVKKLTPTERNEKGFGSTG